MIMCVPAPTLSNVLGCLEGRLGSVTTDHFRYVLYSLLFFVFFAKLYTMLLVLHLFDVQCETETKQLL